MHKIEKLRLHLLFLVLYLSSCNTPRTTMVGNDSDSHGCKGSAGYTWSDLRQACIRTFEIGLQAGGVKDTTRAAYILFSEDRLQAELFLPSGKEIVVRDKSAETIRYTAPKPSSTQLLQTDSGWQIQQNKQILYEYKK